MNARKFLASEVTFNLKVQQSQIPVRGNAIATGDDARDTEVEDEILDDLINGNVWAWADITVEVEWSGFDGMGSTGGASYSDGAQFAADEDTIDLLVQSAIEDAIEGAKLNGWPVFVDPTEMLAAVKEGHAEIAKEAASL